MPWSTGSSARAAAVGPWGGRQRRREPVDPARMFDRRCATSGAVDLAVRSGRRGGPARSVRPIPLLGSRASPGRPNRGVVRDLELRGCECGDGARPPAGERKGGGSPFDRLVFPSMTRRSRCGGSLVGGPAVEGVEGMPVGIAGCGQADPRRGGGLRRRSRPLPGAPGTGSRSRRAEGWSPTARPPRSCCWRRHRGRWSSSHWCPLAPSTTWPAASCRLRGGSARGTGSPNLLDVAADRMSFA